MAVNLSPVFNAVAQTTLQGLPLNAGLIYTYQAGSSTPLATYSDSAGTIANTNPITLGTDGRPPSEIWLLSTYNYKFVLTDSLGAIIGTYDNVAGLSSYYGPSSGVVTSVTGTAPISVTSGSTPNVSFSGVLPKANGGTGTATPPVAFYYQASAQTIATATTTVIAYDTSVYDTNSIWNSSTKAFVPNVAGYYQVNMSCTLSGTSAGYQTGAGISKNGTLIDYNVAASSALGTTPVCSTIVYCNGTTDYVQGNVAHTAGSNLSTASGTTASTTISICYLRGA